MLACFFNYASVVLHLALENYIQKSIGNVTQSGDSFNFKHASSYIFKFYYLNVYVCVHTWRSEDNLWESVLSCHVTPEDQTKVGRQASLSTEPSCWPSSYSFQNRERRVYLQKTALKIFNCIPRLACSFIDQKI